MSEPRGRVFLVNMNNFDNHLASRDGSDMDLINICYLFNELGFDNSDIDDALTDPSKEVGRSLRLSEITISGNNTG